MSDCDVCLNGFDGYSEFFYERTYKARKPHKCRECNRVIPVGATYKRIGGKCEGEMWHEVVCNVCHEINTVFSCGNGAEWGNFWEAMWDYVLPDLKVTSPCFNKLSLEAREIVTEKWWEWKERHAE